MYHFADRVQSVTGSAIRAIFKLLANPGIISFAGGMPAKELFPVSEIKAITQELFDECGADILQYGITEGWAPFRESAAEYITKKGVEVGPSGLIALSGSQQGIELSAKTFLNKGDAILVESPTFLGALQIFKLYEANIVPMEMDSGGVIIADAEEKLKRYRPKLIYLIPTFQNPTGKTLPLERRTALLELAKKYDAVIIEDDPYRELRYRGETLPLIKSFDTDDRVILLSSFSKIISPGLRAGVAVAHPDILAKMTIGKQNVDTHSANISQAIIDKFIRKGLLDGHIKSIIQDYTVRMDCMLGCLDKYFPKGITYTRPDGGLFIWGELPDNINVLPLLEEAIRRNVAFIPGEHFYCDGFGQNTIRLNFSGSSPELIEKGMKTLGELFKEKL